MYDDYFNDPFYVPLESGGSDPDWGDVFGRLLRVILVMIFLVIMLAVFCSCTTTRYVPVVEVHTDTVQITKHQRDSIFLQDSIHVIEKQKGDTVWMEIEKWHTRYVEKQVYDTTYISRTDSVPVPYPVPEYIEKQLSWWQKTRLGIANIALIAAAIAAAWWVFKKKAWWLSLIRKVIG